MVTSGVFAFTDDGQVQFYQADPMDDQVLEELTETIRKRVLRYLVRHDLMDHDDAQDMLNWQGHGGFSLDASVHIDAWDRQALERLVRYCSRPPFASARLKLRR